MFSKYTAPALLAVCLSAVYLLTMAPGLTWANGGSDGGDLISAAATGGVAHPTGYPLYLLMAQLFQLLPVGSPAYRTNLMSATAMVAAALLVYLLVVRVSVMVGRRSAQLAGLISALAFGLAPLVWSQAVITEVYALQAFFIALILYLCSLPRSVTRERLCGLGLGLAAGVHLTSVLLAPAALLANALERKEAGQAAWWRSWQLSWSSLLRQLGWMAAGASIYLVLPIRALSRPPVNWGDPLTPGRFWWLVSGRLYQENLSGLGFFSGMSRLQAWAAVFLQQFGLPGLILGFTGVIVFFAVSRLTLLSLWSALAFSAFAILYAAPDSDVYLIPAVLSFAIWIGIGAGGLMEAALPVFTRLGWVIGVLVLVYLGVGAYYHRSQVDASRDRAAEEYGRQVMSQAPAHAILFTQGDNALFALWYFQLVLHERPDLVVVADELLPFDWYRESLAQVYPQLAVPDSTADFWQSAVMEANPSLPVCFSDYPDLILDCR